MMSIETEFFVETAGSKTWTFRHRIEDGVVTRTTFVEAGTNPLHGLGDHVYGFDPANGTWTTFAEVYPSKTIDRPLSGDGWFGSTWTSVLEEEGGDEGAWATRTRWTSDDGRKGVIEKVLDDGRTVLELAEYAGDGTKHPVERRVGDPLDAEPWLFVWDIFAGSEGPQRLILDDDLVERFTLYRSDGTRAFESQRDHGDVRPWSERVTEFGQIDPWTGEIYDIRRTIFDDGRERYEEWDEAGNRISTQWYDRSDAYGWFEQSYRYNEEDYYTGELFDSRETTFDDGRSRYEEWDAAGNRTATLWWDDGDAHDWTRQEHRFDEEDYYTGELFDSRETTFDDGRSRYEEWDAAGDRILTTWFDEEDAYVWDTRTMTFDVQVETDGPLVDRIETLFDDGVAGVTIVQDGVRRSIELYDADDRNDWHRKTLTYDETGTLIDKVVEMDEIWGYV